MGAMGATGATGATGAMGATGAGLVAKAGKPVGHVEKQAPR